MKSFAHTMLSAEAHETLKHLGYYIRLARVSRQESQNLAAERCGFSKLT